jgi:hypothetical protein
LLRSGFRPELSVKAISNASGGRMPVPNDPRRRVPSLRCERGGDLRVHRVDRLSREIRPRRERERIAGQRLAVDALAADAGGDAWRDRSRSSGLAEQAEHAALDGISRRAGR